MDDDPGGNMSDTRVLYRGTVEYIGGTIAAGDDDLTGDTIEVSFDRETWLDAEVTAPGVWRLLVSEDNLPEVDRATVFVRIADTPEIPVLRAGTLVIR
jgi:hypothetical protein